MECGEWNSIAEEPTLEEGTHVRPSFIEGACPIPLTDAAGAIPDRLSTGDAECYRVLGGGIVSGSLTLVGGDPGIGKSTLMLQVSKRIAGNAGKVLYVYGEESFDQTRLRARRLGALSGEVMLLTETSIDTIRKYIAGDDYALVIIDSIQSVYSTQVPSAPGSAVQVRECANEFLRIAKGCGVPVMLVGHVTKDGSIAGQKDRKSVV